MDDLRPIDADGDEAAWRLSAVTFGYTDEARPEDFHFTAPGRSTWGLYDDTGRLMAKLTDREQSHWFGGRLVTASGVAGVAVAPEWRNRGVARRLLTHLLEQAHERGAAISTLYPTTLTPYRRLGWEEVGALTSTAWPTSAVAAAVRSPQLSFRAATDEDLPRLASLYREAAEQSAGMMDRSAPARPLADYHGVTVAVDNGGTVVGYAVWKRESGYTNGTVTVDELVGADAAAVSSLLWTIGGWASVAPTTILRLPPDHPAPLLFPSTGGTVHARHPWMLRIVDAAAAFAARGYPRFLDGVIDLSLVDAECPWNAGEHRLILADGAGRLEPGGSGRVRMTARGLAAWYAGTAPATLQRAGLIEGDDPLLAATMAGPPAALLDYF